MAPTSTQPNLPPPSQLSSHSPLSPPHHNTPHQVHNEAEVQQLIKVAAQLHTPVTFRAAGTSLSGQAVTDSILVKLNHAGRNWRNVQITDEGRKITIEPGM